MNRNKHLNQELLPLFLSFLIILVMSISIAYSKNQGTLDQSKNQLKQLLGQINQLQSNLNTAQQTHQKLNDQLSITEKRISSSVGKLDQINQTISMKQKTISDYKRNEQNLNKKLANQQLLLAEHLRLMYKQGYQPPLKWVLNQDNPAAFGQLLMYYQYVARSRKTLISDIALTKQQLINAESHLNDELVKERSLQEELNLQRSALEKIKQQHASILSSLNKKIVTQQQKLSDYQRDKEALSRLIMKISSQNNLYDSKPFNAFRHKLPLPVSVKRSNIKLTNQGLLLLAPEGSVVKPVYPGKVVFSDWLNGYGFLIIVDHGRGFMSLYAHNQALLQKTGQMVQPSDTIATVGHGNGDNRSGLYFEIREHGKVIPPLTWFF